MFITQRRDFLWRHLPGDHEFTQHGTVVTGLGFAVDQQHAATETLFAQRRCTRRACGAGADNHKRTFIIGGRGVSIRKRVFVDPDFVIMQFQGIALEAVQRRWFTQRAVLDPVRCLVPWANQAPVTQRPFGQRRPGVGAFALISAQFIATAQQDDFGVPNPDFQASVIGNIGKTGNAVQCHDRSPGRRFT